MAATIPITNLYYLLAYAWDHKLSEAELVAIDANSCPDLNNLFAKILATATHHLVRRGLERSYVPFEEETPRIRGRIDFSASEKIQSRTRGKLVCIYDELSPDVLHNRIVKATLRVLRNDSRVHKDSRKRLAQSLEAFQEVGDLRVTPRDFHRVQLHRNNRAYRFILHLCELIHASLLPDKSHDGSRRFRDFTRDEKIMAKVFEDFVRNFARRHLQGATVSAMHIGWRASNFGEGTSAMLPNMITDVTVAWPDRKLILDCKYYQEALVSRYDALRFRSGNLYQLNAYLTNKAAEPGWENVEGMLLYPSNGYHFDHVFTLHGCHQIRVSTLDLQQAWPEIEKKLLSLLAPASDQDTSSASQADRQMTDEEIKQQFIRASPTGHRLEVKTISWNGHTPLGKWVDFGPLPANADPAGIDDAMNQALASNRFFKRCNTCKELNPLGWMHDSMICQGCAERDLGVVY